MGIELLGRKVWGTGYSHDGKIYGDADWKKKIKTLVADQKYVIVEGRYGEKNLDFHFNIKGCPFSRIKRNDFLARLDKIEVGYCDDVYLYDAFANEKAIGTRRVAITEQSRYIFVSHTATECQMF